MRQGARSRHRVALTLLLAFLVLPELALLGFFSAGAVMSSPAALPHHADLVVVLGGGADRYPRARELVLAGNSERLLLINASASERKDAKARLPGIEVIFDDLPSNSWAEALSVRALMQAGGWHTALVVSDPPHLLRVEYSWSSAFRGTGLSYTLISSDPPWWPGWRWWRNPYASSFVGEEVLKLGYYALHYRFGF
ncbi:MAG: YdcF family protein [Rhodoferax sp.]